MTTEELILVVALTTLIATALFGVYTLRRLDSHQRTLEQVLHALAQARVESLIIERYGPSGFSWDKAIERFCVEHNVAPTNFRPDDPVFRRWLTERFKKDEF